MPIQRPAEKTKQANVYKVNYPIKPGETRFDLNYVVPVTSPLIFSGKILHAEGASDLVVPSGVTMKGDNIDLAGQEPKTQASIYRIRGTEFKVQVEGTGFAAAGRRCVIAGRRQRRTGHPGSEAAHLRPPVFDSGNSVRDTGVGVGSAVS